MTSSPPRVRAVARVSPADTRSDSAVLFPRRRPGYLGPVHLFQLLLVELVVLGGLVAVSRGPMMMAGVAALGVPLVAVTLGRRKGRWWLEARLVSGRYRRRRRRPPGRAAELRLGALRGLAPGLSVSDVAAPDGTQVGVARDDAGWYAVATVSATTALRDDPAGGLPLDRMVRALNDSGQPGAVLQVVMHTVPAPSLEVDRGCPAEQSYRELLQASGATPRPHDRVTWVAVRVDARAMAEDGEVDGPAPEPPEVVVTLVRRVTNTLRGTGRSCEVLDADGLLAALARSCDLEPPNAAGPPAQPREDWAVWHSARLAHTSYWVRDFPPVGQLGALLDGLSAVPSALTSVALILAPEGESVDLQCLARVAAPAKTLPQVCLDLVRGAKQARARLFRLDGEHGPAVYATAPTGGGAR